MERLTQEFYKQSALELAPKLLGKSLCRKLGDQIFRGRILETEAYFGEEDSACHAHKGKTKRTKIMYEEGGLAYIYLCYGIHFLFNVVTGEENHPEAVLIRGIEGFNGPGKLTKALAIEKSLNGENLSTSKQIWLEDAKDCRQYLKTPRIGINYASEEYKDKLWRFVIES